MTKAEFFTKYANKALIFTTAELFQNFVDALLFLGHPENSSFLKGPHTKVHAFDKSGTERWRKFELSELKSMFVETNAWVPLTEVVIYEAVSIKDPRTKTVYYTKEEETIQGVKFPAGTICLTKEEILPYAVGANEIYKNGGFEAYFLVYANAEHTDLRPWARSASYFNIASIVVAEDTVIDGYKVADLTLRKMVIPPVNAPKPVRTTDVPLLVGDIVIRKPGKGAFFATALQTRGRLYDIDRVGNRRKIHGIPAQWEVLPHRPRRRPLRRSEGDSERVERLHPFPQVSQRPRPPRPHRRRQLL